MVPLSILDLSPILEGGDAAGALRNTLDLARHAERWGYRRFWLAEHHNMPGIASAATAVVIGHVAGGTSTLRVGAGGINAAQPLAAGSLQPPFDLLEAFALQLREALAHVAHVLLGRERAAVTTQDQLGHRLRPVVVRTSRLLGGNEEARRLLAREHLDDAGLAGMSVPTTGGSDTTRARLEAETQR
jgi:hypothetical protein